MTQHAPLIWTILLISAITSPSFGSTFYSETLDREISVEVVMPNIPNETAHDIVIYLKGLAEPRVGQVPDTTLIGELIKAGMGVLVVNYGGAANATTPLINTDLLELRHHVSRLAEPFLINPDRVYILPAGYRLARDIEFYRDDQKTYRLDVRYPALDQTADTAKPPLIIQIPHNNDARMNMNSIVKYRDSLLEGLMTCGYAVAVVAHPVAPPYSGIDAMPDAMYKLKSAVRTLRAQAPRFGYDPSKIGVLGFSRGSGMAGLLAATGTATDLEGDGLHPEQSSAIQAVLCQAGRFDHRTLMEDGFSPKKFDQYIAHFGHPVLNADRWDAPSAVRWITANAPPFFLIVGGDDSYRVPQMRKLHEALLAVGAEHPYIIEEGRSHQVTENPENIAAIRTFFDRILKGEVP
jgi:predicted esterase